MKYLILLIPLKDPFTYSVLKRNHTEASTGGTDYFEVKKLINKHSSNAIITTFDCGAKLSYYSDVLPRI